MANGEAFSIPHHDLVDRSIDALAADLADGRFSARELTQAYIDRIEATNTSGPCLRAVNDINPDALNTAAQQQKPRGTRLEDNFNQRQPRRLVKARCA